MNTTYFLLAQHLKIQAIDKLLLWTKNHSYIINLSDLTLQPRSLVTKQDNRVNEIPCEKVISPKADVSQGSLTSELKILPAKEVAIRKESWFFWVLYIC